MRLQYEHKARKSFERGSIQMKSSHTSKNGLHRSGSRKKDEQYQRQKDKKGRLGFKNESRASLNNLYHNYFGLRGGPRKSSLQGRESRPLEHKRRSLADLKSHFKISKNEYQPNRFSRALRSKGSFDSLNGSLLGLFFERNENSRILRVGQI